MSLLFQWVRTWPLFTGNITQADLEFGQEQRGCQKF